MAETIGFPFRITPKGEVSTVQQGSDAEVRQTIAVLILTRLGERYMVPQFGTPDPLMASIASGDIQVGLDSFGPTGVEIKRVTARPSPLSETTSLVSVEWHRREVFR
jgi:hypothetical protein